MLKSNNPDAFAALQSLRKSMAEAGPSSRKSSGIGTVRAIPAPRPKNSSKEQRPSVTAAARASQIARSSAEKPPTKPVDTGPKVLSAAQREHFHLASGRLEQSRSAKLCASTGGSLTIVAQQPQRRALQARDAERNVTSRQHRAIDAVRLKFRSDIRGLTPEHVLDALLRVTADLPPKPVTRTMFHDALQRDLRTYLAPEVSRLVADRIMGTVNESNLAAILPRGINHPTTASAQSPSRQLTAPKDRPVRSAPTEVTAALAPVKKPKPKRQIDHPAHTVVTPPSVRDTPVATVDVSPTRSLPDPASILQTLQNTDLVRDFDPVVKALFPVFRVLHSGGQPHATRIFLDALENRFAIVVPRPTLQKCRSAFRPPSTTLDDVQRLPTTYGIVIQERGAELTAWTITPEYGEAATVKISDLQRYLRLGTPPRFTYEVVGSRKSTKGHAMRDLASFALKLRSRDPGIFPISADGKGRTRHEWTERQLRRMREKNPHRVREHLRKLPTTGEKVIVREHARYGLRGLSDTRMRVHLL